MLSDVIRCYQMVSDQDITQSNKETGNRKSGSYKRESGVMGNK